MAYPNDAIVGPVSTTKIPATNLDGTVPSDGDVIYRDSSGRLSFGSGAIVARSFVSLASKAAIEAQATISRTKVYYATDTGRQYMWTGGGSTGAWQVAEVNDSFYIDGGLANSVYTGLETVDGGTANG